MSIRLRLALWYGMLFASILLMVALLSYALHVRGHYDDVDQALLTSAGHAGAMLTAGAAPSMDGEREMGAMVQAYDTEGRPAAPASAATSVPDVDPRMVLADPAGPPYSRLTGLVPPLMPPPPAPPNGAFGLVEHGGSRWRVYVLPLAHTGPTTGYIAALLPLEHLDTSVARYRLLLLALGLAGVTAAFGGSWLLAGKALRPVADMTTTAEMITHARRAHERVPVPPERDELGRLAMTFNEMLDSLDGAQRAQERFVSDASHELRAPLTAIQGNVELLLRQSGLPETERTEMLHEVEREVRRLARLVADLLALARADAGVPVRQEPVDLDEVVLAAFSAARKLAEGQELLMEEFEPAQISGDTDRLQQLVLILLDNALKYTPAGGSVTLALVVADGQAVVTVADTGVGISAEDLPHVWERFYRADPARGRDPGGTGLGLPIASWIVQQHGGEIDIQSTPGQGTRLCVRLPLLRAPEPAAS